MDTLFTRRTVARLLAAAGALAPVGGRAAMQAGMQGPAGIGLNQREIEAIYGPGQAGQTYMIYPDRMTGAGLHIGFSESGIADYVYAGFEGLGSSGMGILAADGNMLLSGLLPGDARMREQFAAPETPGTLVYLQSTRYTSRSLGDVLDGRRSILASAWTMPAGAGVGDVMTRLTLTVETVFG